jgi:hypothetical protein
MEDGKLQCNLYAVVVGLSLNTHFQGLNLKELRSIELCTYVTASFVDVILITHTHASGLSALGQESASRRDTYHFTQCKLTHYQHAICRL